MSFAPFELFTNLYCQIKKQYLTVGISHHIAKGLFNQIVYIANIILVQIFGKIVLKILVFFRKQVFAHLSLGFVHKAFSHQLRTSQKEDFLFFTA